jgi:transposase-like protein
MSRNSPAPRPAAGWIAKPKRWFVDETYVKIGGVWRYVYQAVDQYGQVIDVPISTGRDTPAARRFFTAGWRPSMSCPARLPTLRRSTRACSTS